MRALIVSLILLAGSFSYAYTVRCWGHNTHTGSYVDGWCTNGSFSGYDNQNRNWVNGFCSEGGSLSAYDSITRDWVSGMCDNDPFGHLPNIPNPGDFPENLDESLN